MNLPDPQQLLPRMAADLKALLARRGVAQAHFIGIRTGGVWVAEALLRELGFEVKLPLESHLCCGSAGTYSVLQPALSKELRNRKLQHLAETAPQRIVSSNIGCIQHLQTGTTIPVQHWVELLDEALHGKP